MKGRFTKTVSRREDILCKIPFCKRTLYLVGLCRDHWDKTHLGRQKRL